ncbi:MAG: ATP phosphoribosyltransferase regulatory subunit [Clostridia bacterium]|nr:ATP phosphoribosyltransferase regulatory subunit [Clostridia bacterium]
MKIDQSILKKEDLADLRLRRLYESYGYSQYKMSKFEEYDLYVRNKSFLISDSVITFTDTNGKLMALKPDVTLSIVKNTKDGQKGVQKVYYRENVYRVSQRSHAYKEILQVGLECLGSIDVYCIAEVLALAAKSLEALCEDYILNVSHLGLLSSLTERIGVPSDKKETLLAYISEKNAHDAYALCREAGLGEEQIAALGALTECDPDPARALSAISSLFDDAEWKKQAEELDTVLSLLPVGHVRLDFSVISDTRYYNGIVFQGYVNGIPEHILSGGQYDRLMERMNKKAGALGFAVYLDRLESLLTAPPQYDVDTFLLYEDSISPVTVYKEVEALVQSGVSVTAGRERPEKMKYRRLLQLTERGVEALEENA